jgi:hypothetical protein
VAKCAQVALPGRLELAGFGEQPERVLANRLQQPVSGGAARALGDGNEGLVHQSREQLMRQAGCALPCGARTEAAREHRQAPERLLFDLIQEPVAPLDRGPHLSMTRGCASLGGAQLTELGLDARQDLGRRHGAHLRRGKLDRERQTIHALAQLLNRRVVIRAWHEVRSALPCALDEEAERVLGLERRQAPHRLPVHAERLATRGEDPQAGARPQESIGELCALVDHVVAVVEDEKQVAIRDVAPERVGRLPLPCTAKAEGPGGLVGNIRCLRTGGEIDEPHTVNSAPDVIARQLQSEAGLADTAGAGQGHKPRPAQHLTHLRELVRPPEQ